MYLINCSYIRRRRRRYLMLDVHRSSMLHSASGIRTNDLQITSPPFEHQKVFNDSVYLPMYLHTWKTKACWVRFKQTSSCYSIQGLVCESPPLVSIRCLHFHLRVRAAPRSS
uniref:Uncharacterized protein n=1 Tax=Cacopsylla melanoneura TaxID=428564 RepID=A0A8D9DRR2_9HEMI